MWGSLISMYPISIVFMRDWQKWMLHVHWWIMSQFNSFSMYNDSDVSHLISAFVQHKIARRLATRTRYFFHHHHNFHFHDFFFIIKRLFLLDCMKSGSISSAIKCTSICSMYTERERASKNCVHTHKIVPPRHDVILNYFISACLHS